VQIDPEHASYRITDFKPGTYFVVAHVPGYFPQVADGVNCPRPEYSGDHSGCAWGEADPYVLGQSEQQVDFNPRPLGREVRVRDSGGNPLAGVAIDYWSPLGLSLGSATTNAYGRAILAAEINHFVTPQIKISTDNYLGYVDQVYQNQQCPEGTSVYRGGCSLAGAALVPVQKTNANDPMIEITLLPSVRIFEGDFE
jgi:hypothetical protein